MFVCVYIYIYVQLSQITKAISEWNKRNELLITMEFKYKNGLSSYFV